MKLGCFRNLLNRLPAALILAFALCLVNTGPEAEASGQKEISTEKMISDISEKAAGKVYRDLKSKGNTNPKVAVVAAVPLSDLKRETEFGRLMAEYLLTDLSDLGIKVRELRLGTEIKILAQTGEFILSRNIGELSKLPRKLDYVLVSTFSNTRKKLIVQGRLVDLGNGLIKTSWRDTLPLNREILGLFNKAPEPHTIAVRPMR